MFRGAAALSHCLATPNSWLDIPLALESSRLTGLAGSSFAAPFLGGGFAAARSMRTISCSQMQMWMQMQM